jgi:hypothetical protein
MAPVPPRHPHEWIDADDLLDADEWIDWRDSTRCPD